MTTYIIKVILCSTLFIFAYKLLLETEKGYRFNRFYLLASLVLSFYIPTVTFSYAPVLPAVKYTLSNIPIAYNPQNIQRIPSTNKLNNHFPVVPVIYLAVTILLLIRFGINLTTIWCQALINPAIPFEGVKIVLIPEDITPHSFFDRIFINKEVYLSGRIEKEILVHELTHARQKHTADVLFIEILQALFWFNPALFFFKKALRLNHEFLADEAAVNASHNPISYQHLLIEKANQSPGSLLASQLNYSITKKRLTMISKQTSRVKALFIQTGAVSILVVSILLFSTKTFSQDTSITPKLKPIEAPSTKEGVSRELLNEYDRLAGKILVPDERWNMHSEKLTDAERNRLETIFLSMSKDQQEKQTIMFIPVPPPLPSVTPTDKQIASWKNAKMYGLWIDDKRVSNAVLNNYSNADFAQLFISKLSRNAINYGKHYYQVNLMTAGYYDTYYKQTIERNQKTKYNIMIRRKSQQLYKPETRIHI